MLKVHYDLLHELAERLRARLLSPQLNPVIDRMEEDPDAFMASVLYVLNASLKDREDRGRSLVYEVLGHADYQPRIKKMRKLLDQNPGEHTPAA